MTTNNKRIKECNYCGELFKDNTRPNNKKTCSPECAYEARKARQRNKYQEENPPKPNQRQLYYYNHHEYAFWNTDRNTVRNQMWKTDVPYSPERIQGIVSARELEEYHGGRKRHQEVIQYDGDEKGSHGVRVQFVEHNREPSEVVTYTMSPEELKERQKSRKRR